MVLPGLTASMAAISASALPDASKQTSKVPLFAAKDLSFSGLAAALIVWSAPMVRAISRVSSTTSVATTSRAPAYRAARIRRQPIGPCHQNPSVLDATRLPHGVQAHREWFRERGLTQRDMARDWRRLRFVAHQDIAKCPLHVRETHGTAVEAHVETVIGEISRTIAACTARLAGIDRHPITGAHTSDRFAHGGHRSSDFVTKHHRFLETHGAETAMPIAVQVGTAYPARTNANQDVPRAKRRGFGALFNSQVEWRVNDKTAH